MKLIAKLLILCLTVTMLFCGCSSDETSEPDYSKLIVSPVDLKITDCITDQQLTSVLGHPMQLLGLYEENTQAIWMSEDGACQVNINLQNQDRAVFDSNAATQQTKLQEGLGDTAYWSVESGELVAYANGYALGVAVTCADTTMNEAYTRQIADILLKALQPE